MVSTLKMAKAYFDSKGIHTSVLDEEDNILRVGFKGDNTNVSILMDFSEDGEYVTFKSYNLCTFSVDKIAQMYKLCSELNKEYKWVKFYVDESDNTLTAQDDAIIQLDSCGVECYELVGRMVAIVDDVYPRMMKTIWQ